MTILNPPLAKFSPAARCAAKIGYPNRHHHTCMVWTRRRCPGCALRARLSTSCDVPHTWPHIIASFTAAFASASAASLPGSPTRLLSRVRLGFVGQVAKLDEYFAVCVRCRGDESWLQAAFVPYARQNYFN